MHSAAPREKNLVSRQKKNCHISGTTQNFSEFFFQQSCKLYSMNIRIRFKLYTERESQNGKTFAKVPILDEFSRNFQKSCLLKPSDHLKNSRKMKPETLKKIKKKTKKFSKIRACTLMFFSEPTGEMNMLISFGKIFIPP